MKQFGELPIGRSDLLKSADMTVKRIVVEISNLFRCHAFPPIFDRIKRRKPGTGSNLQLWWTDAANAILISI